MRHAGARRFEDVVKDHPRCFRVLPCVAGTRRVYPRGDDIVETPERRDSVFTRRAIVFASE